MNRVKLTSKKSVVVMFKKQNLFWKKSSPSGREEVTFTGNDKMREDGDKSEGDGRGWISTCSGMNMDKRSPQMQMEGRRSRPAADLDEQAWGPGSGLSNSQSRSCQELASGPFTCGPTLLSYGAF